LSRDVSGYWQSKKKIIVNCVPPCGEQARDYVQSLNAPIQQLSKQQITPSTQHNMQRWPARCLPSFLNDHAASMTPSNKALQNQNTGDAEAIDDVLDVDSTDSEGDNRKCSDGEFVRCSAGEAATDSDSDSSDDGARVEMRTRESENDVEWGARSDAHLNPKVDASADGRVPTSIVDVPHIVHDQDDDEDRTDDGDDEGDGDGVHSRRHTVTPTTELERRRCVNATRNERFGNVIEPPAKRRRTSAHGSTSGPSATHVKHSSPSSDAQLKSLPHWPLRLLNNASSGDARVTPRRNKAARVEFKLNL
jgi:hypothetical protein